MGPFGGIGMILLGVAYKRTLSAKSHAKARYKDRERLAQVLIRSRSAGPDASRARLRPVPADPVQGGDGERVIGAELPQETRPLLGRQGQVPNRAGGSDEPVSQRL